AGGGGRGVAWTGSPPQRTPGLRKMPQGIETRSVFRQAAAQADGQPKRKGAPRGQLTPIELTGRSQVGGARGRVNASRNLSAQNLMSLAASARLKASWRARGPSGGSDNPPATAAPTPPPPHRFTPNP